MEPLKLAGLLLLGLSAVELLLWRVLAASNPNLHKHFPVLVLASAVGGVVGFALFWLG
ncbi:hypothetical protein Mterra_00441 [Calidithermus terrae]|uniref:Uncharacterized protein n=1 Tax=Calidithermus terrae TaxID=1408545 RepID=A0A399F5A5_9DEIN|nr:MULTISPECIES: hypothetical protein [Calidithermus]RIH90459.1 hypothetical protein Mterra_00441 [Calidithermus terrae]